MNENRNTDELVYMQTDLLTVTIKGAASHPAFPGVEFREKESTLRVCMWVRSIATQESKQGMDGREKV